MIENIASNYVVLAKWLNENQGVLGVGVFLATLAFGWASGIFAALRQKPRFKVRVIDGPTFACTFPTGTKRDGHAIHRTGIALYLAVANVGSAASSIENIAVGYHWNLPPFTLLWVRYGLGWFWLRNQVAVIHDFQAEIGENIKVYPFLIQRSHLSGRTPSTYLQPGQHENGVVYFEQTDSWGACFPASHEGFAKIKVAITDVFGRAHTARFKVRVVDLAEARRYNPSFGKTLAELRRETLPHDSLP